MERIEQQPGVVIFKPERKDLELITLRKMVKELSNEINSLKRELKNIRQELNI